MRELVGVIEEVDLGGGGFALRRPDGGRVLLIGELPPELVGQEVEVQGEQVEAFGFLMTGDPTLQVHKVRRR